MLSARCPVATRRASPLRPPPSSPARLALRSARIGAWILACLCAACPARALDHSVAQIGATPHFWKRHGASFEGNAASGVVIGIVWTGFDLAHPDLMDGEG